MKQETLRVISEYHLIEVADHSLKYRPRAKATFGLKSLSLFCDSYMLAEGEINIDAVSSFEANSGTPIFGRPFIAISFQDPLSLTEPRSRKTQYLSFRPYLRRPAPAFYKLIEKLRELGIREVTQQTDEHI